MAFSHGTQLVVCITFFTLILALSFSGGAALTNSPSISVSGRNLLQVAAVSQVPTRASLSDDTVRVDPLDGFKKYRGGYDITNKHYWSSTIFTGVYGYAIGVVWLFCGLLYGGFLIATIFICKRNGKLKKRSPCNKHCYLWPVILAIIFTVLAITASGLILGGNARFHSQAGRVVNIIIDTANEASRTIRNTTGAMKDIRDNLQGASDSDATGEASGFLTSTSQKLDVQAADIREQASKNRRLIDKGLQIVNILTILTVCTNLVAVISLSVCGILRLRRALHLLIIICWFLTVLCWWFFGMYFFFEKFSSDTCSALENFQQNPYNNSLSPILPCDDLLLAQPVLSDVSAGIYNLVNEVNANISVLQATMHPNLAYVCNPFSAPPDYQYHPDDCPANTIRIGDIPQILKILTCSDADNGACKNGEFISAGEYKTVEAYTTSIQRLLNAYPSMENLVECQSVKDAFSVVLAHHCKPLKRSVHMVWTAMVFLAVVMVALVLLWTAQVHHVRQLHSEDISVKPHSSTATALESGKTMAIRKEYSSPASV